jgi:hypothetical protein
MKFVINDGRAWYKQVVMGILISLLIIAIAVVLVFVVMSIYIGVVVLMIPGTLVAVGKFLGVVILGVVMLAITLATINWARSD